MSLELGGLDIESVAECCNESPSNEVDGVSGLFTFKGELRSTIGGLYEIKGLCIIRP